jgi:GDP-L-fucose synthase
MSNISLLLCLIHRQAMRACTWEEELLSGPLEPTNEGYAIAKIAAIKLCETAHAELGCNFISLMPTNLYGPGDSYELGKAHVLPAMITRFDEAKRMGVDTVTLWGDGSPLREFLHVEDLARAVVFALEEIDADSLAQAGEPAWINVGSGQEVSILELAKLVRDVVYADSDAILPSIEWDASHPNGTPRKLLDSSRINARGWQATIPLREGIESTYSAYCEEMAGKR